MGDRANIVVKQRTGECPVVIYTHWSGSMVTQGEGDSLDRALKAPNVQERIGDSNYFTQRLIEALSAEVGISGIGTSLDDNEHPVQVVDSMTGERFQVEVWDAQTFLTKFSFSPDLYREEEAKMKSKAVEF